MTALNIKNLINQSDNHIKVRWIKAYSSITKNERADLLAKEAAQSMVVTHNKIPISGIKRLACEETITDWQDQWTYSEKGRHTYWLLPSIQERLKDLSWLQVDHLTCQVLTGHGNTNAYLKKIGKRRSDNCDCIVEGFATPARKIHSKERIVRTPEIIQRAQELIFEDPGVVSSEGDVMPPYFFNKGENVTKDVYLHALSNVVKPWMVTVSSGKPYVFQQDGAPAHTSHLVQNWLSNNVVMFWSKEFWPPNSPDLNPLDFYIWSVVERVTNKTRHANITSLRAAIDAAFTNIDRETLKRACARFTPRIEAVIQAGWGLY
ncbi:uncharacterized protein [Centruroides vittatus]|uniref:uncharacterized protein n=1 Tax=Centruroides vittatus TaxID=120091 RepID=UPI00350F8F87